MEVGITVPLQRFLGWRRPPEGDDPRLFLCWEAHRAEVAGHKLLFVVNCANRFAAVRRMTGADWKRLGEVVPEAIGLAMAESGVPDGDRRRYLDVAGEVAFTRTHGRRPVGGLNRAVEDAWAAAARDYDSDAMFQEAITSFVNGTICSCAAREGYVVPREAFLEDLEELLAEG